MRLQRIVATAAVLLAIAMATPMVFALGRSDQRPRPASPGGQAQQAKPSGSGGQASQGGSSSSSGGATDNHATTRERPSGSDRPATAHERPSGSDRPAEVREPAASGAPRAVARDRSWGSSDTNRGGGTAENAGNDHNRGREVAAQPGNGRNREAATAENAGNDRNRGSWLFGGRRNDNDRRPAAARRDDARRDGRGRAVQRAESIRRGVRPRLALGRTIFAGFPYYHRFDYGWSPAFDYYYYPMVMGVTYGGLAFFVEPPITEVYIDGEFVGIAGDFAGQAVPVLPGSHRIELYAAGYEPVAFDILVNPGEVVPYSGMLYPASYYAYDDY
jgi:hypothetical protein